MACIEEVASVAKCCLVVALVLLVLPLAACGEPEQSSLGPSAGATQEAIRQEMIATRQANTGPSTTGTAKPVEGVETPDLQVMTPDEPAPTSTEQSVEPVPPTEVPGVLSAEPAGYLLSRLPPLAAFPEGFAITREGRSNPELLSQIYTDPQAREDYQLHLERLGLQRAALRFYDLLGATDEDVRTRMVHMRTHVLEFDTPEHAAEAMAYEQDRWLRCECEMNSADIELVGDQSLAVHGINTGTDTGLPALAVVWVRQGSTVWSAAAESLEHNSLPDAVEIMKATISQQDDRLEVTLPWTLNLADGFVVTREQPQSAEEVAQAYEPDITRYLDHQLHWGFSQAHMRAYAHYWAPVGQMDILFAQVIEFGSPDQAATALAFEHEFAMNQLGYVDASMASIGDQALAATGTEITDEGIERDVAIVMVQIANRVYTYSGTAQSYVPLPDVNAIAVESLSRTGN